MGFLEAIRHNIEIGRFLQDVLMPDSMRARITVSHFPYGFEIQVDMCPGENMVEEMLLNMVDKYSLIMEVEK